MHIHIFKKKLFIFFIFVLNITILYSFNIYASNVSDFEYTTAGTTAFITAYKGSKSDVIIPSKIGSYNVKGIEKHAFNDTRNQTNGKILKNVTISEGITYIGDFAFNNCTNLVSLKLPNSLTSLGDQTFIGCTNLKTINIPPKVTSFGYSGYMFQETGFESFIIPINITKVPANTFRICKQLKHIYIYSDNVNLGNDIFEYGNDNLIIYGNKGSNAEAYAKNNGYTFKPLPAKTTTDTPITATAIKLNQTSLNLRTGGKGLLTATFLPSGAAKSSLIWASSAPDIVSVNNGVLLAKSKGNAIIYVATSDKKLKASCKVTVTDNTSTDFIPISSIKLNKITLSLTAGGTETLIATVTPDNATDKTLIWQSDNEDIATVKDGLVTAISEGKATIQITSSDGSTIAACDVYVTAPSDTTESSDDGITSKDDSSQSPDDTDDVTTDDDSDESLSWKEVLPQIILYGLLYLILSSLPFILLVVFIIKKFKKSKNIIESISNDNHGFKIVIGNKKDNDDSLDI